MPLSKRAIAEFLGTFWLVFGGCGSAVLAAGVHLGIGYVGVAFAFGLTVLTMAFAIGHVSGCHLNPAVSIGLVTAKRFPISELPAYIIAQVLGAICASGVLYLVANGNSTFSLAGGFASNGYADHSPEHYSLLACFLIEVFLTAFFLLVILGATDERAPKGFAPIAIGLCLTLIQTLNFKSSEFVPIYELASTTGASTTLPFRVTAITTNPTTIDPSAATCALLIPQ
jgi:aquaporin Z